MYSPTYPRQYGIGDASSALIGGGISAGVQLATSAASLWLNSIQLSHTADTATTQVVNGLEPLLRQNVAAYLSGPRTCADQAAAIAAFLSAYQWLISVKGCGNGSYGSAGNRCISDRFGPGGATDGNAQFPWAIYYYAPIANDPQASGCAAQLAADNPNAALQSATGNIYSLLNGSSQQTTAGMFDTTGAGAGTGAGTATTPTGSVVVAGEAIPESYLLIGAGVLALALLM